MGLTKKSITISQDLYEATKNISDNFSSVVAAAIEEYLKKKCIEKANLSFGSWEKRKKESIDIVNELREENNRNYAEDNH